MRFELLSWLHVDLLSRIPSNDAHMSWLVPSTFDGCYGDVNYCGDLLNDICLKLKYCSYLVIVITFWNSYNHLHRATQVYKFCE